MFGRRRKAEKMPADLILSATSSTTIDANVLSQLQSRGQGLTAQHKALLATTLCTLPSCDPIQLAQAAQSRRSQPPTAGGDLAARGLMMTAGAGRIHA